MATKSKIKALAPAGTWTSEKDNTLMYRVSYEMEDGSKIRASHQSEGKFNIGDEVEYEVKGTNQQYGAYGSVKKPNEGGGYSGPRRGAGGGLTKEREKSFALSYAKDLGCAHIAQGRDFKAKEIIQVADVFHKWLQE